MLCTFPNGDTAERRGQAIVVRFAGRRRVLSDSPLHGGVREDLCAAFNWDCKEDGRVPDRLLAPTYGEHLGLVAARLGLDPNSCTGLSTAASMENAAIVTERAGETEATAIVTAGVDYNAGCAGDPADWDEAAEPLLSHPSGTVNLLLHLSPNLPAGTLARALVTAVEAKAAALSALCVPSVRSSEIATGSGTDGAILVCDAEAPLTLTFAGKHCKLGELIGCAVRRAVSEALYRETGLSPERQFSVNRRLGRFGLAPVSDALDRDPKLAAGAAMLAHVLDELQYGRFPPETALCAAGKILYDMGIPAPQAADFSDTETARDAVLGAFSRGMRAMEGKRCSS